MTNSPYRTMDDHKRPTEDETLLAGPQPSERHEKEVLLISDNLDDGIKDAIYEVADSMTKAMGVTSFNLVIYMPPIAPVEEDWSGFPFIARMVDRGDPATRVGP